MEIYFDNRFTVYQIDFNCVINVIVDISPVDRDERRKDNILFFIHIFCSYM